MCDDDWVNLAISDDSIVVHLLLLLHHPPSPPPPPTSHLQLYWTVRQRRSRSLPRIKPEPTTSPTTPLSWSGATSASGGAVDVYEDTSHRNKHVQTSRSKIANPSETTTTKKSKRKKTLAELKEEENLLLRERKILKNELASLRVTVEKHRATNESLKRMKLDLESRQNSKTATTTIQISGKPVSPKTIRHKILDDNSAVSAANASFKTQEIGNQEYTFVLPDLNLPVDESLRSNTMH
ncbi:hypothetical protein Lal_00010112 [Lupinus albus]|uniref:Uncharacterized protein n=1 Tax=Lupinus albus TaxID=3870 RepID=A0A6A4NGL4_LUPAL|nr:hypothetical protein Lalb_Chr24g0395351 [Lupinus albus]KAF1859528.1 hypothetical protein Lal_00010112 [Lupinus albus]